MRIESDSLDRPLFEFEGPSDPPGPVSAATRKVWEEYKRLLRERDEHKAQSEPPSDSNGEPR
jgi:hypothetical protein